MACSVVPGRPISGVSPQDSKPAGFLGEFVATTQVDVHIRGVAMSAVTYERHVTTTREGLSNRRWEDYSETSRDAGEASAHPIYGNW